MKRTTFRSRLKHIARRPAIAVATIAALLLSAGTAGASNIQSWTFRVAAHDRNVHYLTYHVGDIVEPMVTGDGDTDLDCYLYIWSSTTSQWRKVAEDTDRTDVCILQPVRPLAGDYMLSVRNLGNVYNQYELEK